MTGGTSEVLKTGYEWSLEANHRLMDLSEYDLNAKASLLRNERDYEEDYFTYKVSKFEYMEIIEYANIKENSTPRKTPKYFEYRMYGMVPYNISSIQSGIQFGHAVVEYGQKAKKIGLINYDRWADNHKTFIVLNGGTTNENKDGKWYGSMQKNRDLLLENEVLIAQFKEPDLNDSLSAVVFLVDERVFNKELYPDYVNVSYPWNGKRGYKPTDKEFDKWEVSNIRNRNAWVEKIGGPKNDFLRTHLRQFKLAN